MSYSFSVRASNKAEAKERVDAELAKVVESQAIHARDRAQAQHVAEAFIDLLVDDPERDIDVNVHGSVSWRDTLVAGQEGEAVLIAAGVAVSAMLLARP